MASEIIHIAILGVGGVGQAFLEQLHGLSQRNARVKVVYLADSKKCLSAENSTDSIPLSTSIQDLKSGGQEAWSLHKLCAFLSDKPRKSVVVDNTSNQGIADFYPRFLENGISVVTANKKAFSGSWRLWSEIFPRQPSPSRGLVYHESSVGAGLPVISTLKDLVETGDKVQRIEGVFSGTMSFLFNSFAPVNGRGGKWSLEVAKAKELGYTEPDPRDDLNGLDVARKLVILARLSGLEVESTSAFPVQSLIPKELDSAGSAEEFIKRLPEFDEEMEKVKQAAEAQGKVVRYVGSIDVAKKEVKVGIEEFHHSDPIVALQGSDNIISFHTERYGKRPLIIQGAGAGADVTAMGVTGDLLKVLQQI